MELFTRALHEVLLLPDGAGGWRDLSSVQQWRLRDRLKTVAAALVLCLNVGVDPPDVIKPNPCARLECWLDPLSMPAQKALEAIGKALQAQYECELAWLVQTVSPSTGTAAVPTQRRVQLPTYLRAHPLD